MAILVAAHPVGNQRLHKVLAGREVTFVERLDEALRMLAARRFAGFVLGVQFDESRVLELLQHLHQRPELAPLPVVCIIGLKGKLSPAALGAFAEAARALGARDVLDAADFPDDEAGDQALRAALERLMPASRAEASLPGP